MPQPSARPCPMCRLIRTFLLMAIPFMFLMWFKPEVPFLSRFDLTTLAANSIALGCVAVIAIQAYREFWVPYRSKRSVLQNKTVRPIHDVTTEQTDTRKKTVTQSSKDI
jgi:disulfide bond formation protein DsbB